MRNSLLSSDATLQSKAANFNIDGFDPSINVFESVYPGAYSANIVLTIASVPNNSNATVFVNNSLCSYGGSVDLSPDSDGFPLEIRVVAEDGTVKFYTSIVSFSSE